MDPQTFFAPAFAAQPTPAATPAVSMPTVMTGNSPVIGGAAPAPAVQPTGVAAAASGWDWFNPVKGARVSSRYGPRKAPTAGASTNHNGIDLAAPIGSPVGAAGDGEVIKAWNDAENGNAVRIRHADGSISSYGHLDSIAVKPGMRVTGGQLIGTVGSTGRSTGPHTHFVYRDAKGNTQDPSFILKGGKAIPTSGVAAAASGQSVNNQPITTIGQPVLQEEPGGVAIDPQGMGIVIAKMLEAGYSEPEIAVALKGLGAWGGDQAQRGTLVFQGQQPGATFAASREAQLNNEALGTYGDLAKTIVGGNINEVGGTTRQGMQDATTIQTNREDNATSRANAQTAANATVQAAQISANSRVDAAGVKGANAGKPRKVTASDFNLIDEQFDTQVPLRRDGKGKLSATGGQMKSVVMATAGNLLASGEASNPVQAVAMAVQAHGVERQPNGSGWTYSPNARPVQGSGQRVIQSGGQGFAYDPRTGQVHKGRVSITNW
ncbi:M23 family metallopeptidase [Novosphingobium sp.]|uniref:M23 family metallopeptidase n=1 Tax=Novosphingobium sp. TaxID=1874826 RepID=UPI0035B2C72E